MKASKIAALLLLCSAHYSYAQCNAPNGNRVTLSITQPSSDKVVVTNINASILTLKAAPSQVSDSKLTWKFETFKLVGAKNTGRQVAVGLSDWPAHSFFGNGKKIELTYDGGIGDCKEEKLMKVYFPPMIQIETKSAWYKYWKDGGAASLNKFSYRNSLIDWATGKPRAGQWNPDPFTAYTFYVSPTSLSLTMKEGDFYIAQNAYLVNTNSPLLGVGRVIAHEFGHEEYWQTTAKQNVLSWWSGLSSQDKQNYATNTSQLTSAINAQLSSAAFKTASETFAVSCETNAVNCIDTTKDWSEGGANY